MNDGPLATYTVIELGGIGPLPHFGMMCSDLGARVIRVERHPRPKDQLVDPKGWIFRNRRSIAVDLKSAAGAEVVLRLAEQADVLVEGHRPGVAERLGLGPEVCLRRNPRLVYGRLSGWGRTGPLAPRAGHDINFLALSGALHAMGPSHTPPSVPLNLIGDYGGGSLMLLNAVLVALLQRHSSCAGQIVDVAMSDGVLGMMSQHYADSALGGWDAPRGENLLDGGAPFYNVYETSDGRFMAVGATETRFFARLIEVLGLERELGGTQWERAAWPQLRDRLAKIFGSRTQQEWIAAFADADACVTPALTMAEAAEHPHHQERGLFAEVHGHPQVGSAFRFGRAALPIPCPPPDHGGDTEQVLESVGFTDQEVQALRESGVIA